jgi:hypothetical protein
MSLLALSVLHRLRANVGRDIVSPPKTLPLISSDIYHICKEPTNLVSNISIVLLKNGKVDFILSLARQTLGAGHPTKTLQSRRPYVEVILISLATYMNIISPPYPGDVISFKKG